MLTHAELKAKALADPQVQAEYDALAPEFALIDELLTARQRAGLSQQEVVRNRTTPNWCVGRTLQIELNLMALRLKPPLHRLKPPLHRYFIT